MIRVEDSWGKGGIFVATRGEAFADENKGTIAAIKSGEPGKRITKQRS